MRHWMPLMLVLAVAAPGAARAAEKEAGQEKQVERLAAEHGVEAEEVRALREKGLGWGEVEHALSISRRSGRPVSEIMAQRESGMGWGRIAERSGVSLREKPQRPAAAERERFRDAPRGESRGRKTEGRGRR